MRLKDVLPVAPPHLAVIATAPEIDALAAAKQTSASTAPKTTKHDKLPGRFCRLQPLALNQLGVHFDEFPGRVGVVFGHG